MRATAAAPQASPVLVVSHVVPYPAAAGNELRLLKLLTWLKRSGFRVVLLLNHEPVDNQRRSVLEGLVDSLYFIGDERDAPLGPARRRGRLVSGIRHKLTLGLPDSRFYRALFGSEKTRRIRSDTVKHYFASDRLIQMTEHLCRKHNPFAVITQYIFAAPCLDAVPRRVSRIIDTIDVFSRKHEQVLSYGIDDPLSCSPREERGYLLKADLVIAIQPHEASLLRKLVRERDVITVGIDFDVANEPDDTGVVAGRILIVGSDNPLNQHGLKAFCALAWPAIRAQCPDAVVRIVGTLSAHLDLDDERVQRVGWVADLDDEYRKAAIVINPTVAGTGLKIKTVEALCRGKALVGTRNSVEGLETEGEPPYVVCDDWTHFGDAVIGLLHAGDERVRLQHLAVKYTRARFSTDQVYAPLDEKLRSAQGEVPR